MSDKPDDLVTGFPGAGFPVVYADAVTSLSNSPHVVKFYLARLDPHFDAKAPPRPHAFAQVIMSTDAFVQTCAFFESYLARMEHAGVVTRGQIEAAKQALAPVPRQHDAD